MARKFKIEDKRLDAKPTMYVTLHKGPYTKPKILNKTGWLTKMSTVESFSLLKKIRNSAGTTIS